jgi:(2Fe-2S) ferredoxin
MGFLSERTFAHRGEFAGFVETEEGKRRMLLRIDGEEVRFKLTRDLRREFAGRLVVGQKVEIDGHERRDLFSGKIKRVVEHLHLIGETPSAPDPCVKCPIRVCAKKNCWRSGGKELWQTLEHKIAAAGLQGVVHLKAVGCLDYCKHAPNLAFGETHYRRCTRAAAEHLIDSLAARLPVSR